ncbi:bifunctional D-glycero-beta-D-manno-heptose-7-phosphate kinase/D-glycero-beta-D-manno-heptose 1-phosphate adenylyltransferase HldE [Magnetococcales bacterium HHB-1]
MLETVKRGFQHCQIMVVGDLMLDRYLWGDVSRISPEAPVPVLRLRKETENGGGAANVAINLAHLQVKPLLFGLVGQDDAGRQLIDLLKKQQIDPRHILVSPHWPTTTKTRVLGNHQQMIRLDREADPFLPEEVESDLIHRTQRQFMADSPPDAVILSDYGKGVLTSRVCQEIIKQARAHRIPVLVDPKGVAYHKYRRATILSPNRRELAEATHVSAEDLDQLLRAGETLRENLAVEYLAVTLSELGIALLDHHHKPRRIPSVAQEVFDVSGAGDTVIGVLAAGLASGLTPMDALKLANMAAGIVVGKVGTTPINQRDLLEKLAKGDRKESRGKVYPLSVLQQKVQNWKKKGLTIVFTNGCFDILHRGHVSYLERARALGDRLIVGLNRDQSVRRLKGETRPLVPEEDRARLLAALSSIDAVTLFSEDTPLNLIVALKPDVLAKGADYQEKDIVGAKEVKQYGGRVARIAFTEGRSTTTLVEKIRNQS